MDCPPINHKCDGRYSLLEDMRCFRCNWLVFGRLGIISVGRNQIHLLLSLGDHSTITSYNSFKRHLGLQYGIYHDGLDEF